MTNGITHKDRIENKLKEMGYTLGCYDQAMDKLSQIELKKVINNIYGDYTDVDVKIRGKIHVVEISVVDDEIDFTMLTQAEYISRYGDERWDND